MQIFNNTGWGTGAPNPHIVQEANVQTINPSVIIMLEINAFFPYL